MLHRGNARCTVYRAKPPVSDGAGGWVSPGEQAGIERCTVRMASHSERERAGLDGARVTHSVAFRQGADVRRGDLLTVRGMPALRVTAIPDAAIPGRATKTVWCEQDSDQHGEE